jgi:oligoribonuclease
MKTDKKIINKDQKHSLYLWLDLEMTGLDVEKERIIEVGAIITDTQLKAIDEFHRIVFQPNELLNQMDDWNKNHHGNSGLLDAIPNGDKEDVVEKELINWCQKYFNEPIILAGNSIGQDRLFIDKYFKDFAKLLHYRQLDVTSFKLHFQTVDIGFQKKNTHRAIDDIRESIEEFKFFWSYFKK